MSRAPESAAWWVPFGRSGRVDLFHVDLSPHTDREAAALAWLDEQERARLRRFAFDGPRRRFTLCRAALRAELCKQLDWENERLAFETTRHGKPFALIRGEPAPISFNVSHSGRHGLVAIAPSGQVGVDVEERDPQRNLDLLIETVLAKEEQDALAAARGPARVHLFFKLWTLKEALLKALGEGFRLDATRIKTPPPMLRGVRKSTMRLPQMSGAIWHVEDLGNRDFAAAVAYTASETPALKD